MEQKDKIKLKEKFQLNPLKPCPFCSGESIGDYNDYDKGRRVYYKISCSDCELTYETDDLVHPSKKDYEQVKIDAIKHWNTRIP